MRTILACGVAVALTACQSAGEAPQDAFMSNLSQLCGQTLTGNVVSQDVADADWRKNELTVGPISCEGNLVTMPLAVGANKSRTWFLSQSNGALTLKHRHTLEDGSLDPVTNYGGTTDSSGTSQRQDFPVDQYSIENFKENGLDASITNVWTMELKLGEIFAYELNREGRHFRAEFPLK